MRSRHLLVACSVWPDAMVPWHFYHMMVNIMREREGEREWEGRRGERDRGNGIIDYKN